MDVQRLAAFSNASEGGNPAGVVIAEQLPSTEEMQQIAFDVGYSETAFAQPLDNGFRVRYFSPLSEVPFCGHATIALGAALAKAYGNNTFNLTLNEASITVEANADGQQIQSALQSPPTHSRPASEDQLKDALKLFNLSEDDIDWRIPPGFAHAGANHLVLFLKSREKLSQLNYSIDQGKIWMDQEQLVTVLLGYIEHDQLFHTRNAFASGGVFEDPATGAATAALAGYLRDIDWPHQNSISIIQGEDMGSKSLIQADIPAEAGSSIRVSGSVRNIQI